MQKEITLQVGVKVLLQNRRNEYLLLKRTDKYGKLGGQWDIPGGRINPEGELIDNLRREVKEETGLVLQGRAALLAAQDIFFADTHVVRLTYKGHARGKIVLDTQENDEYRWATVKEMRQMRNLDPFVRSVILKYLT